MAEKLYGSGKNQLPSLTVSRQSAQIHIINRVKSLCSRWNPRRLARHFVRDYAIPSRHQDWRTQCILAYFTMLYHRTWLRVCHVLYGGDLGQNLQLFLQPLQSSYVLSQHCWHTDNKFLLQCATFLPHLEASLLQNSLFSIFFLFSSGAMDRAVSPMQGNNHHPKLIFHPLLWVPELIENYRMFVFVVVEFLTYCTHAHMHKFILLW